MHKNTHLLSAVTIALSFKVFTVLVTLLDKLSKYSLFLMFACEVRYEKAEVHRGVNRSQNLTFHLHASLVQKNSSPSIGIKFSGLRSKSISPSPEQGSARLNKLPAQTRCASKV
jgi:hypothetical protein